MPNQHTVKYDPKRNQQIILAYIRGEKLGDIASRYGMPKNSIWRITNREGLRRISKKRVSITDVIVSSIIKGHLNGITSNELAEIHDVSKGTVFNVLRRAGYDIRRKHLNESQIEFIKQAYLQGKSTYEIGREIGFSSVTAGKVIRKAGIEVRSPFVLSAVHQKEVAIDYQNGESSESIAKRLGVSANSIRDAIKRNGVKIREVWPKKPKSDGQFFNPNYDVQDLPECKFSGIYKFTNKINGKIYVGQSQNIYQRFYRHRESRMRSLFSYALKKYGIGNFIFEVLEKVDNLALLDEREQYWMDFYQSYERNKGYNLSKIAGSVRGIKRTKEQVERIRAIAKERSLIVPNYMLGKRHSDETKRLISEKHKGKKLSPEHRAKCGRPLTSERKAKLIQGSIGKCRKKIAQIDAQTGTVLRIWNHAGEINQELGLSLSGIQGACRGQQWDSKAKKYRLKIIHAGFKWQYV